MIEQSINNLTLSSRSAPGRLKVCHIVTGTYGASWMCEQLRELRDQCGFEVAAIVSGVSGRLVDRLDAEAIPHFATNFEFNSLRAVLRAPRTILRIAFCLRRERFDIVQTHVFVSMVFGRIAGWLADVPVRVSMISGPFHLKAHSSRWIDRSTHWMETALVPSCEESLRLCREMGVAEEKLNLIYYGADEHRFDPVSTPPINIRQQFGWSQDTPVICMVAYFYPRFSATRWRPPFVHGRAPKGHEDLVKAAPTVLAQFPSAKILLVGSGQSAAGTAYMEEIKELVRHMNLEESITFAGFQPNINSLLREVDVAVQPSLDENLGGTLEALLMECPLVATRVGGMVDTVRDKETGLLVNPASPRELADAIIQLLSNPEQARALGRAGRELTLKRFTLRRTASDLAELYQRLLAKEERRRGFYKPLTSLRRMILAVPILLYLAIRLFFVDTFLRIYLPMFMARLRSITFRRAATSARY
jgi:glycosyltransferase involved in cell wall biosynthesis